VHLAGETHQGEHVRSIRLLIAVGYIALVTVTATLALLGGQRPYAPLSLLPPPPPVTLTVVYGTEKDAWLQQAAQAFMASGATADGAPITIDLQGTGSREAMEQIADGTLQPVVWSPASDVWTTLLDQQWQQRNGGALVATGGDAPQSLVQTPLVVVAWKGRVARLGADGQSIWQRLHANRDAVRWAHTAPTSSNSGTQALVLMAYDFYGKQSGLTVDDVQNAAFVQWLEEAEQAATFGDSSGTLMNDMVVFGPSRYDAMATYENLALQALPQARSRWNDDLVLIYPPANILSNHPYALLDGSWVTPQQRTAARQFRDFLLGRAQQEQALQFGFRPALADVALDGSNSPLRSEAGVQLELPMVETPDADTLNALLDVWTRVAQR
jgi:ABC-type sulfate transport system substrate-binding protein